MRGYRNASCRVASAAGRDYFSGAVNEVSMRQAVQLTIRGRGKVETRKASGIINVGVHDLHFLNRESWLWLFLYIFFPV